MGVNMAKVQTVIMTMIMTMIVSMIESMDTTKGVDTKALE